MISDVCVCVCVVTTCTIIITKSHNIFSVIHFKKKFLKKRIKSTHNHGMSDSELDCIQVLPSEDQDDAAAAAEGVAAADAGAEGEKGNKKGEVTLKDDGINLLIDVS